MKLLLGLSMMFILLISQASNVAAANNQGLEWNVVVDNRFDYDVKLTYHNSTFDLDIDDQMYVTIDDVPSIPDNVTSLAQLTFLDFTTYWDNGTAMDNVWKDILSLIPFMIYPIGNWSFITQLIEDINPQADLNQDASVLTTTTPPNEYHNTTFTLMKSDGALAHLQTDWIRTGSEDSMSVELIREGYTTSATTTNTTGTNPLDGDNTLLLVLGGSAAVMVVVLSLIMIRRK